MAKNSVKASKPNLSEPTTKDGLDDPRRRLLDMLVTANVSQPMGGLDLPYDADQEKRIDELVEIIQRGREIAATKKAIEELTGLEPTDEDLATIEKSIKTWDNPAVIEDVPQTTNEALPHQEVEAQETRRKRPSESVVAEAVGKIALANEMLEAAKERLEATVDEARAENVSWAKIGEALDISSSAAHTKFTEKGRKRNRQAQQRYRNKK